MIILYHWFIIFTFLQPWHIQYYPVDTLEYTVLDKLCCFNKVSP